MTTATKTYRVDHAVEGSDKPKVYDGLSRDGAMKKARALSRVHGSAYAISTLKGVDQGQRVYHNGGYSHQDDQF